MNKKVRVHMTLDITTINFHYKNIFNRNAENEQASEQKG